MNRVRNLVEFYFLRRFSHVNILSKSSIGLVLLPLDRRAKLQKFIRNWLICSFEDIDQPGKIVSVIYENVS